MKFDKAYFQPLQEEAPPGKDAEEFIKANKGDFKKRYGSRWEEVLYATAWKKYGKKESVMNEDLGLGKVHFPDQRTVMDINRKIKAAAPEVLKDYRRLLKKLDSSFSTNKEIVYIRDVPDPEYAKKTGMGDAHRVEFRTRTKSPLGKEVVASKASGGETSYETVLAFKEEYIPEAIYKKKIGVQGIRDIKKGTPPYTVVAMKGKPKFGAKSLKVVDQSKPAMVVSQIPAIIYDFLEKHGKDDSLTIGVEDKSGQLVYTYYKPFGEEYIPEGTWAFPDKPATIKKLKKLLKNPIPVGVSDYNDPEASKDGVESKLKGIIGDDELFDRFDALRKRKGPKADARPVILKWLKKNDVQVESVMIEEGGMGRKTKKTGDFPKGWEKNKKPGKKQKTIQGLPISKRDDKDPEAMDRFHRRKGYYPEESEIEEGGLGGAHKMAKGRIGVSPSHAKKFKKDKDARGGRWDGDDYIMSKKDYAKLHKDFKSKIHGKPYATAMDPKTGATILTPVILEATRTKQAKFAQGNRPGDAADPYTVKYSYTKKGRIMVAVLASKKDAEMFLRNVKGLGMRGIIVKGAHYVKEESQNNNNNNLTKKFSHGNLPVVKDKDHAEEKKNIADQYIANLKEAAVDKALVDELVLYITNDGQLYRQRTQPIIKNLSKKVGDASFDGLKAIKAFMYLVKDGIKKYEKEHAGKGWAKSINKETKQAIAEALLDYYTEEIGESKKR